MRRLRQFPTRGPGEPNKPPGAIMKPLPPRNSLSYRSSRPDAWIMPRPHRDASLRYMKHGPILPMEQPGWFARLFGRRS
jgi:hypothetical protein